MKKTIVILSLIACCLLTFCSCDKEEKAEDVCPYVTFTASSEQTLSMSAAVSGMEYSVNKGNWATLETSTVIFGGGKGNLRLRSKNLYGTAMAGTSSYSSICFGNDTPVECSGDIRTLIDYENYENVDTKKASFEYMFSGCEQLISAPDLPLTELSEYCYGYMFNGCTGLTEAPELPATELAPFCYWNMFSLCTSITKAPELPATTLAENCYDNMFWYCTSLKEAPVLPATKMETGCYYSMFYGCSSLIEAPVLPAESLTQNCYVFMFYLCTKLEKVTMKATSFVDPCTSFNECLICFLEGAGMKADNTPMLYVPQSIVDNEDIVNNSGYFQIKAL